MADVQGGPTRSAQTNEVLHLGRGVAAGQGDVAVLRAALEARLAGCIEARAQFDEQMAAQPTERAALVEDVAPLVGAGFEGYAAALKRVLACAASPSALPAALDLLTEATEQLILALDAFDTRSLTVGPTSYPAANALALYVEAVREGQITPEAFASVLEDARAQAAGSLADLQSPPAEMPGEAVSRLREGFEAYARAIDELACYLADRQERHLEEGLDQVFRAYDVVRDGFDTYRRLAFEQGPTSSAVVNTFLRAAALCAEGRFERALFEQSLGVLEQCSEEARTNFVGLCNVPTDSGRIKEEIPRALEALDANDEALRGFRAWLQGGEPAVLEAACARLVVATEALAAAQAALEQVTDSHGSRLCTRCSASNAMSSRQCCSCGATLPRVEHLGEPSSTFTVGESGGSLSDGAPKVVITEHLKKIVDATNAVADGKISAAEYAGVLQWMEARLQSAEQALGALPRLGPELRAEAERAQMEGHADLLAETLEMAYDAIATTRNGLASLGAFLQDGDRQHLLDGLPQVWEGSQQMLRIQRITDMIEGAVAESSAAGQQPSEVEADDAGQEPAEHLLS